MAENGVGVGGSCAIAWPSTARTLRLPAGPREYATFPLSNSRHTRRRRILAIAQAFEQGNIRVSLAGRVVAYDPARGIRLPMLLRKVRATDHFTWRDAAVRFIFFFQNETLENLHNKLPCSCSNHQVVF